MQTTDWTEATRNWRPPGEIAGQGPRQVRLAAGGIALTVLSLVLFLGAGVVYYFMSRTVARDAAFRAALDTRGVEGQATVTRHWRTGDKEDTPMVAYEFQFQGRVFDGRSSAPRDQWRALTVGATLPVRFVPENPELNHPSAWAVRVMPPFMPVVIAGFLALAGLLPMWVTRLQTRILRDGRAAPAVVTAHHRAKDGYAIRYEFRLPDGTMRRGRGGAKHTPPAIGDVIPILFDPETPRRNEPYPLSLVRLER